MPVTLADLNKQERAIFKTLSLTQQQIFLDLPESVRRLVGRWAPTDACSSEQTKAGACTPDPRVTSQAGVRTPVDLDELKPEVRFRDRVRPYRLKAARKGDLLLSPGGPSGMIGALLSALTPAQDYSHMGIIIEDGKVKG